MTNEQKLMQYTQYVQWAISEGKRVHTLSTWTRYQAIRESARKPFSLMRWSASLQGFVTFKIYSQSKVEADKIADRNIIELDEKYAFERQAGGRILTEQEQLEKAIKQRDKAQESLQRILDREQKKADKLKKQLQEIQAKLKS